MELKIINQPLSIEKQFPNLTEELNKKQIAVKAVEIAEEFIENGEDLARIYATLARNKEMIEGIMEAIKPALIKDIQLGGKIVSGCKLEQHNTTRYDYSNTPIWNEIKESVSKLDEKRKLIEKTAKSLDRYKGSAEWRDNETGEVCEVCPAIPSTTETIKCTIL